ncbi:MAG: DNA polymerase domain-containing protein [Nitrososphaerales archaeon]
MEGWILDIHPDLKKDGKMVVWIKQRNGKTVSLVDEWSPSIYVYGAKQDLDRILRMQEVVSLTSGLGFECKIADVTDGKPRQVLRLTLKNAKDRLKLAKIVYCLAPYGRYQIYNADIDPAQIYMYEHDLFPLAFVGADVSNKIKWNLLDSVETIDYELPDLKQLHLQLQHNKQDVLVKVTDPIKCIELLLKNEKITIEGSEQDILLQLVKTIQEIDPDVIFTNNGDSFTVPSLLHRAEVYGISEKIVLGRCDEPITLPKIKGSTYFSYGRVIYKPRPIRFYGRVHDDLSNTFVHAACGLDGCIEVSRTCRVPLDTTARASIGRIMTSIEYYHAYRDNILIPWKPALAERFKSSWDLMVGDRGGFIFEPKVGVHDSVGEIDFSSLYPTLMLKKNISAETICCDCCPDSQMRVPELDYNICEKRIGIVPKALDLLIRKRARYKELKKSVHKNREIYDARQIALKWILVAAFGFMGFRNAKFGRIDAHIAVCAFARKTLFDAVKVAENNAYEIVHGIVDSLWLKKRNATEEDYADLCSQIKKETELPISFEGIYKWVAFLPSKMYDGLPVLNRYFGVFRNGEIKIRGIEARKHDTPEFIRRCQMEMLQVLAKYNNCNEVKMHVMEAVEVLAKYVRMLEERKVPVEDLVINRKLSKKPLEYRKDIVQAIVARQLAKHGRELDAGEPVGYVITDFYNKRAEKRAAPIDVLQSSPYDVRKYSEMLIDSANTILNPFGLTDPLQMRIN